MREKVLVYNIYTMTYRESQVFDNGNAKFKPKVSPEDGITEMAQIPKAASQRGHLR